MWGRMPLPSSKFPTSKEHRNKVQYYCRWGRTLRCHRRVCSGFISQLRSLRLPDLSRELDTDWWLKFLLVVEWYISSGTTIWRLTTWWPCHLAGKLGRALTLSAALNIATQVGALPERRGRIIMLVFWIYCKHTGPTDRLSLNKHRSQWKGGRCSAFLSSHNSRLVLQHQPGCGKIQIIIWKFLARIYSER